MSSCTPIKPPARKFPSQYAPNQLPMVGSFERRVSMSGWINPALTEGATDRYDLLLFYFLAAETVHDLSKPPSSDGLKKKPAQVQDTCKKWSQAAATPMLGGVRECSPFWTPEAVSYPVENMHFSNSHRRSHFRTPDRTMGGVTYAGPLEVPGPKLQAIVANGLFAPRCPCDRFLHVS
jgi:hypothetical protein